MKKALILLVSLLAVVGIAAATTVAFISTGSNTVTNEFTVTPVAVEVVEDTILAGTKKDVALKNTGEADAYMRAYIVVNWVNSNQELPGQGNFHGNVPVAGKDYELKLNNSANWKVRDGIYYWLEPVAKGDETENLIESCKVLDTAEIPENHSLNVEILAQAIQANGMSDDNKHPVEIAWSVTVNADRSLTVN